MPRCLPSSREDQCVTASAAGGGSSVAAMIAASSILLGRPLRGWSSRPASPCTAKRSRHLITVGRETPSIRAVAEVPAPSAIANTIRARSQCPAETVEHRVQYSSVARSSSLTSTWDDGIHHHPTRVNELTPQDTSRLELGDDDCTHGQSSSSLTTENTTC